MCQVHVLYSEKMIHAITALYMLFPRDGHQTGLQIWMLFFCSPNNWPKYQFGSTCLRLFIVFLHVYGFCMYIFIHEYITYPGIFGMSVLYLLSGIPSTLLPRCFYMSTVA